MLKIVSLSIIISLKTQSIKVQKRMFKSVFKYLKNFEFYALKPQLPAINYSC